MIGIIKGAGLVLLQDGSSEKSKQSEMIMRRRGSAKKRKIGEYK